eukprot:TRINITY_DN31446_c0_g1_i1.p1 TRINITY_DN31446_c0_g1~~TRINITY_DN31446_c0_g1_i1.p1  ORF type:complete len:110 (+),score=3.37 TRINITY_DN31446_c0_g1_i1:146-475(+)
MELSLKPLHLYEVNSVVSPCLLLYLAIYCLQLHFHNATFNYIIQVFIDSASKLLVLENFQFFRQKLFLIFLAHAQSSLLSLDSYFLALAAFQFFWQDTVSHLSSTCPII